MTTRVPLLDAGSDLMPTVPTARSHLISERPPACAERPRLVLSALMAVVVTGNTVRDFDGVTDTTKLLADLADPDDELLHHITCYSPATRSSVAAWPSGSYGSTRRSAPAWQRYATAFRRAPTARPQMKVDPTMAATNVSRPPPGGTIRAISVKRSQCS
ncbi:hypothetical protein Are01nite_80560 [Actinoplanes regularis]|nr:hypothetical protein Are01nite_80560 [Actinoplanes regularis]